VRAGFVYAVRQPPAGLRGRLRWFLLHHDLQGGIEQLPWQSMRRLGLRSEELRIVLKRVPRFDAAVPGWNM
jgi:hypothetical protein